MKSGAKAMKKEFKKIDVGDVEVSQHPYLLCSASFTKSHVPLKPVALPLA
jgi:hypothetical protein